MRSTFSLLQLTARLRVLLTLVELELLHIVVHALVSRRHDSVLGGEGPVEVAHRAVDGFIVEPAAHVPVIGVLA